MNPANYVEVGIAGQIDRQFLAKFRPSLTEVSHGAWHGAPLEMTGGTKGAAERVLNGLDATPNRPSTPSRPLVAWYRVNFTFKKWDTINLLSVYYLHSHFYTQSENIKESTYVLCNTIVSQSHYIRHSSMHKKSQGNRCGAVKITCLESCSNVISQLKTTMRNQQF
jgi:hypothetical protein